MKKLVLSTVVFLSVYCVSFAQIIPFGSSMDSLLVNAINPTDYEVYFYKPLTYDSVTSPILWVVHGLGGDGSTGVSWLQDIADKQNALIVSVTMQGNWSIAFNVYWDTVCIYIIPYSFIFKEIYQNVLNRENRDSIPIYLTGFSAGGQFVTRYMLLRQPILDSIPIVNSMSVNPFYYTFCTDSLAGIEMKYACGLSPNTNMGTCDEYQNFNFICNQHVKQYYNENYGVLIGTLDTALIAAFPCMDAQGLNRYERAKNFYAFSDTNAVNRGTTLLWEYDTVPNVGHAGWAMYNTKANALDSFTIAENMLFNTPWHPVPVFVPVANFNAADTGLTVTFTDATLNAPSYWYWDFGDGDTSLLQNPVHTYSSSGTYYVCLTAGDSCVTDSYCDSVNVITVGIDDALASLKTQLNIQPNPFNETTTISFMLPEAGDVTVEVYNYMGQKVTELYNNFAEAGQLYKVKFNTEGLPAGIYFTVVHATNERIVRKMLLVR